MKKLHIFMIFALIFSFGFAFFNMQNVKADSNYNIKITTDAICDPSTNYNTFDFSIGYSKNDALFFEASLYDNDTKLDLTNLKYVWKLESTNEIVCQEKIYSLNKEYSENQNSIMMLGKRNYTVEISNDTISKNIKFSIDIIDDANHEVIITQANTTLATNENGAYVLSNKTPDFTIKAILSKTKVDCTINWFLKTPNSNTFNMFIQNGDCIIKPSELITSKNGFGIYKLYASAQSSSILFTSKTIYFEATAGELADDVSKYKIVKTIINNSKSDLEAFTFTVSNANEDGLDFDKIYWYVNNEKLGKGESFSYEPTSTAPISIKVEYQGANLISLDEIEVSPRTTGTLKLLLYILGVVVVLSVIFTISVKRINKKRDVVW